MKFGPNNEGMLNVRADSPAELITWLDAVDIQRLVDFGSTMTAVQNAAPVTQPQQPAWQPPAPTAAPQGPPQGAPAASAPSGPPADGMVCIHGPRRRYDGKKNNRPYTAYFCPLEKGDPNQCAPVWG